MCLTLSAVSALSAVLQVVILRDDLATDLTLIPVLIVYYSFLHTHSACLYPVDCGSKYYRLRRAGSLFLRLFVSSSEFFYIIVCLSPYSLFLLQVKCVVKMSKTRASKQSSRNTRVCVANRGRLPERLSSAASWHLRATHYLCNENDVLR